MRDYSRRNMLKLGGIGAAIAALGGCASGRETVPYLVNTSNQIPVLHTERTYPELWSPSFGTRGDFNKHVEEKSVGGIDYIPTGEVTEIVPVTRGVVIGRGTHPLVGNFAKLYHGNGMVSAYLHLKEKPPIILGSKVERNNVIGEMGNTGSNAKSVFHLHLTLYGPESMMKSVDHSQWVPNVGSTFTRAVYDPEEFSVAGKHKRLPFALPQDMEWDDKFDAVVKEAREKVDEFQKAYPILDRKRPPLRIEWMKKYVADRNPKYFTLDYEIGDILDETSSSKTSIPKADAAYINQQARQMLIETRDNFKATAPIKDNRNPSFYAKAKQ